MKIYVGTYAKYNNGSIAGQWLNLEDYKDKDAFYKACLELHNDESDPELMFQDWEGFPEGTISESNIDSDIWIFMECEKWEQEAIKDYMDSTGCQLEQAISDVENGAYHGEFDTVEEFAEDYAEQAGFISDIKDSPLHYYIDWRSYALDMELNGYWAFHEKTNGKIAVFFNI